MNDIFNFIDKLNVSADTHAEALSKTIESQMVTLKWKAARCAKNCFIQQQSLQAALKCEQECKSSVESVIHFTQKHSAVVMSDFESCLDRLEGVAEGRQELVNIDQGISTCYKELVVSMRQFEKKVLEEFNYYQ
jgi:predicted Zn-ribbon and HTH transcriptional regulator